MNDFIKFFNYGEIIISNHKQYMITNCKINKDIICINLETGELESFDELTCVEYCELCVLRRKNYDYL